MYPSGVWKNIKKCSKVDPKISTLLTEDALVDTVETAETVETVEIVETVETVETAETVETVETV